MQWCVRAWYSISAEIIANCFHHTGLFDYEISPTVCEVHPNDEDSSVVADLEESLRLLSPHHPMSLAYYTNPEEMDMNQWPPKNENDADKLNDTATSVTTLTNQAKLDSLHIVISLLDTTITDHNTTLQILRSFQREIRFQASSSEIQMTLDSFM
ncbi:24809_t:CDS:2 [Gigaspora margarita]|uniref:24809_t:CDS:1 n=1 Tax=Gigaspora margarita TaxID=4874 RepID=A0ABN7VTG4_GIGMA|nr:24809_t:CDS:2 [Gigaspora margarita]